jgi:hydroxymethylpyrimidine/phosphomethylpyrimidine kinase
MKRLQIALTIAGSDSGGGAGIQADLKTFAALGVHGTSVVTCLTAQNPKKVLGVNPVEPTFVLKQLEAVFSELPPRAVKTGMLFSAEIIEAVRKFLIAQAVGRSKTAPQIPVVVDPVMIATSGAPLLKRNAVIAMKSLFETATIITPNLDETAALLKKKLASPEDLRDAARELFHRFGCAALVKGGHLRGMKQAIDFFYDGREELILTAPYISGVTTHGTGCTYSAAIAGCLANGAKLPVAVIEAKKYITASIANSSLVGSHQTLAAFTKANRSCMIRV